MRFKIALQNIGKQRILPIDNQYFLSAWIYRIIANADKEFARFLHNHGYTLGNKQFKLFCYSPLLFEKYKIWKEKALIEVISKQVVFQISFCLNEAAEKFIIGLFNRQQFYLGNKFNGVDFAVTQIERLPDLIHPNDDSPAIHSITNSPTKSYQAKSPVVISYKTESEKYARYLSPEEQGYGELVKQHLMQKYQTVPGVKPIPGNTEIKFILKSLPKSKLITIKPHTPQQSKVRGFLYRFSITAPEKVHRLILDAGFGEKNAQGFGWVEPGDAGLVD
jgi:CRISPR-associated endoribonuclease Cas6